MKNASNTQNNTVVSLKEFTANPAPLGLLGFGMTTVLLNIHNAGYFPMNTMILAMGIFFGGMAQVIAGIMEFKKTTLSAQLPSLLTASSGFPLSERSLCLVLAWAKRLRLKRWLLTFSCGDCSLWACSSEHCASAKTCRSSSVL